MKAFFTKSFKKDCKNAKRRNWQINKLEKIMHELEVGQVYEKHVLKGSFLGCCELHVEFDWVLIYKIIGSEVKYIRTGTHSNILNV